jgi:hypothetical protein
MMTIMVRAAWDQEEWAPAASFMDPAWDLAAVSAQALGV